MHLGVFGGTFDPPHNGHLRIAHAAKEQLLLERVLFTPAGVQPLKQDQSLSPALHRAKMVELAIAQQPGFEFSRVDLERHGPHYTVDLLRIVSGIYPGAPLWFILGSDSLVDLLRWRDPQGCIDQARLAAYRRVGFEPDWDALDAALPNLRDRLDWIDAPPIDISATDIRLRVRAGRPIAGLVPPAVEVYIAEQRLYA
jgi:nicotinate-nucleotide adenylyltransferase